MAYREAPLLKKLLYRTTAHCCTSFPQHPLTRKTPLLVGASLPSYHGNRTTVQSCTVYFCSPASTNKEDITVCRRLSPILSREQNYSTELYSVHLLPSIHQQGRHHCLSAPLGHPITGTELQHRAVQCTSAPQYPPTRKTSLLVGTSRPSYHGKLWLN